METESIAVKNKNLVNSHLDNSKSNIAEADEDTKCANTGDDNNNVLWIMIIMAVFFAIAMTVLKKSVMKR
jgi:phage terminase Nu1 subunit (DNA packaging protein)